MPAGQLRELLLDALARLPQPRVQPDAVHVARQRAHVGRDRHAVVVQDHDDRRAEAAGLRDGLERDAAGHRAVADDGDDLAVLGPAAEHRLLDPDGVADRGRGVAGAHDVVLGLGASRTARARRTGGSSRAGRGGRSAPCAGRPDGRRPTAPCPSASRSASARRPRSRTCRGWRRNGRRSPPPCRSAAPGPPAPPPAARPR